MGSSSPTATLLCDEEHAPAHRSICSRCGDHISGKRSRASLSTLTLLLLVFGFCQPPILLLSFGFFRLFDNRTLDTAGSFDPNDYVALEEYNATKKAYSIVDAADPSQEADEFWHDVQKSDGIVAVDGSWAQQMKFPSTVSHPYEPHLRLYQVNVFHSLHCLYRIRNRLISKVPLGEWPRNDIHTMHCVDHIRNDLLCNADVSLSGSDEFISFNSHAEGRKCRDLGAVQEWAAAHTWPGYRNYLTTVVGFDGVEAERVNMATAGQGPWYKSRSKLDKETGKIELWFVED